jgi:hypothetical protein
VVFAGGFADFGMFCGGKSWSSCGGYVATCGLLRGVFFQTKNMPLFWVNFPKKDLREKVHSGIYREMALGVYSARLMGFGVFVPPTTGRQQ